MFDNAPEVLAVLALALSGLALAFPKRGPLVVVAVIFLSLAVLLA